MDQRKKRISLVAFVGTMMLLAALASLAATTWATPAQNDTTNNTIPDKYCYDEKVARGQSTEFEILVHCPITDTWYNTVVTDSIDANLQVTGLSTTRGYAAWTDNQVTFTLGTILPGGLATLKISVRVNDDAPQGYDVYNTAYLKHTGWDQIPSEGDDPPHWMFRIAYEQYMPLTMRR